MSKTTNAAIGLGYIALSAALLAPYHVSRIRDGTNTERDVWYVVFWSVVLLASAVRFVLAIRRSRAT